MTFDPLSALARRDQAVLKALSALHYLWAGFWLLLFPILFLNVGLYLYNRGALPPPEVFKAALAVGAVALMTLAFAALLVLAGYCLARRRGYRVCLLASALNLIFFPVGTALAVWTVLVLQRESVKRSFFPAAPGEA